MTKTFDKNNKQHKFFYRDLSIDLNYATNFLKEKYRLIANNQYPGVSLVSDLDIFSYTKSVSTQKAREYNLFQFYSPFIYELYSSVVDMVYEACDYYEVDFNKEQYVVSAWFNINKKSLQTKLDWHDHINPDFKVPAFHGYYCVNAEPSETLYQINKNIYPNKNKNNRAILSVVGYPHSMADWNWEEERITIAYDILPMRLMYEKEFTGQDKEMEFEQHFFPIPPRINK
jgi:hypothetical protein